MKIHTASEGISFARKLESDSSKIYEDIIRQYGKNEDIFQSIIKENKKNIKQIERAYYGVITDAIEGGYAFNLETDEYSINIQIREGQGYNDMIKQAAANENTIIRFYTDAAEQSKSLMADLPRNFLLVAKKRKKRITEIESLISS